MRLQVQATDEELVAREEVLRRHLDDLVAEALCRCQALRKSAEGPAKTPLERVVAKIQRRWSVGYRKQMVAMVAELKAKMASMPSTLPTNPA